MHKKIFLFSTCILFTIMGIAQNALKHFTDAIETRYDTKQPSIHYKVTVDSKDLSYYHIQMYITNVPDTFRLAMVTHPEYDDRFWRYVEDFSVETEAGRGSIVREDSSLWKIIKKGNDCVVLYSIHLPLQTEDQRPSWTPFLSATGGLIGGPHTFMYIVGHTLAPSHVSIKVPAGWQIATGLQATPDPTTFFAPSVFILTDCPVLVGNFKTWMFNMNGVPHRVVYWPLPNAKAFDEMKLVNGIEKLVRQAASLFGRFPYRDYTFIIQDNAYGSLEHSNSVTVGIPSNNYDEYFTDYLGEVAHEYFHTWNLVRIHPAEYGDVSYKKQPLSKGLWFSEGFTMFYADLLLRRAALPTEDSTRIRHLERLIRRYYNSPGDRKISPEKVSMAEYGPQGMLGDYMGSSHLQGELLGTMIDFIIRDATNGHRSIDDVMKKMMERFSGEKGFTGKDIEQIIKDVCGCDVAGFFDKYVRGNNSFDLDKYLRLAGLEYNLSWKIAADDNKPIPDYRLYSWVNPSETAIRLWVTDPESSWGKAGLHTGDIILSVNDKPITSQSQLSEIIRSSKIGDHIRMEIKRSGKTLKIIVIVSEYKQPVVTVAKIKDANEKQKKILGQWLSGK